MVSGNAFAPTPPDVDASGLTPEEFLEQMFEFEYCSECGRDAPDHTAVIGPMGQWFAYCLKEPRYDKDNQLICGG